MARRTPAGVLAAAAGLTLVLAACGSGGDTPAPQGADTPSSGSSATSAPETSASGSVDRGPGGQPPAPSGGQPAPGGTNADPVRWNDAVCKGLGGSMRAMLTALKANSPDHKPEDRKAATVAYLGATEGALGTARTELTGLGRPAALRQDTHNELIGYLGAAVETIKRKQPEVAGLDVKDPRFEEKLQPFAAEELDPARLLAKFEEVRTAPGMEEAYRKAPECQRMVKDTEGAFGG
ncbi:MULTISPECIES: hypothetical protein [unclassified Crossiella]|uniref:hypothetical protein n=1 Tax=unclassified Crossiella TaxID=2620835 RepID=UPI001FFFD2F6|nr:MULTISPECIES: hypothetical protein [unclassified Crossiella]MCK2237679.1 hypothetical protein [Crossiella sp. S99.2]MCK2254965.1 hypothetical protein [Crossiella sp. S99.1]